MMKSTYQVLLPSHKTNDPEPGEICSDEDSDEIINSSIPLRKEIEFTKLRKRKFKVRVSQHLVKKVRPNDTADERTLTSSRWAYKVESPLDEGEIIDHEDTPNRSGTFGSESNDDDVVKKPDTPDIVEVEQGVSESDSDFDGTVTVQQPKRSCNIIKGCRYVDEFERLNEINEGTYGVVSRAKDKKTGEIVALKRVKMERETEGFPVTSLREINILSSFRHPSVVGVKEVVVGKGNMDCVYMVMEYMEHDLKGLFDRMKHPFNKIQPFSRSDAKCLMLQLLSGVKYLHDNWVIHRDLKPSNLLYDNCGSLKICDFGMARQHGNPLKPYTPLVVTLWYRAPEILLGAEQYSTAVDMWSVGCIMAELLSNEPLFSGRREIEQLDKIFKVLGTPNETIWPDCTKLPGYNFKLARNQGNVLRKMFPGFSVTGSSMLSEAGFDLLSRLLTYDPEKRITAEAALDHEWFREVPLAKSKDFMPTYPPQNDQDRRCMHEIGDKPDPYKEQWRRELNQRELGTGCLFGL